ncbi:hypothetical protein CHL67_10500 [Prosthecochloris sp. GSB1]|nr:hypothetical protein CHL67_10500 [Prosthecochloris sp. GSB1]
MGATEKTACRAWNAGRDQPLSVLHRCARHHDSGISGHEYRTIAEERLDEIEAYRIRGASGHPDLRVRKTASRSAVFTLGGARIHRNSRFSYIALIDPVDDFSACSEFSVYEDHGKYFHT